MKTNKIVAIVSAMAIIGLVTLVATRDVVKKSPPPVTVEVSTPPSVWQGKEVYAPIRRSTNSVVKKTTTAVVAESVVPRDIPPEFFAPETVEYYRAFNAMLADTNAFPALEPLIIPDEGLSSEEIDRYTEALEIHGQEQLARLEKGQASREEFNKAKIALIKSLGQQGFEQFLIWNSNRTFTLLTKR